MTTSTQHPPRDYTPLEDIPEDRFEALLRDRRRNMPSRAMTQAERITAAAGAKYVRTTQPGDVSATVAASSWPHSTQWAKQGRRPLGASEQGRFPTADPADMGTTLGYEAAAESMQHAEKSRGWLRYGLTLLIVGAAAAAISA